MSTSPAAPALSLRRAEAEARRSLLDLHDCEVWLDLTGADSPDVDTFGSRTVLHFESGRGETFLDLKASSVAAVRLDGAPLDLAGLGRGRLPLVIDAGAHVLEVEATMSFRNDGEGLHRSVDPADGEVYVYGMSFMDAAPSIFACFDQPDLKVPYTLHVTAPARWVVVGNGPATRVDTGQWDLARTAPLSTYFVTLVAGPYHLLRSEHDGIALGLSARASLAGALDAEADELFTLTGQCFDELHRLFAIRYPFGDYHQAFVPEFNAGAMENPGCVTFRDQMVFESRVTRAARIDRATTIAHEMAHQWFGNLVTPRWWDDLWLNESFAEYLGNRVTADATAYDDAWAHQSFSRRQWGLIADQRPSTHPVAGNGATDALGALQDFDGISYAKGSAVLKQLAARLGDDVFLGGVVDHMTRHRFGNATMADLVASWERAGAGDLSGFTRSWLSTAGLDTLSFDRAAGDLRRVAPRQGGARDHVLDVAIGGPDGWQQRRVELTGPATPFDVAAGSAVVLDVGDSTWAASCLDDVTVRALPALMDGAGDELRAAVWNNVRSAVRAALLDPAAVVDLLVASPYVEDLGDSVAGARPWTTGTLLPAAPAGSTARVHDALRALLAEQEPGSEGQLRVLRSAVRTAEDPDVLRGWLSPAGLPAGVVADDDLRWRLLVALAALGAVDRTELDAQLAAAPSTSTRVEHTRARAALPDAGAKAFAWDRFTGATRVTSYEVVAAGGGLWRPGQQDLTAPYVERFAADLAAAGAAHTGWSLADAVLAFYPVTHVEEHTVTMAHAVIADDDLPGPVRRKVVDATDDLACRLALHRAFPATAPLGATPGSAPGDPA